VAKRKRAKPRKPTPREIPASSPPLARETIVVAALLLLLVAGVYWPVIHHDFVGLDDAGYFLRNPHLDGRFGLDDLVGAFARPYMANWTPLTSISIAIDNSLYGVRPSGFLVTNAVLHAAASILLFLAVARLTGRRAPAAFVAAVFAVHPLHVESVAWASQRKDVLMGVGWTATMLAYATYRERGGARPYGLLLACSTFALLAKPAAATLPFALLLLDYWPLGRFGERLALLPSRLAELRRAIVEKLPIFAVAALSSATTLIVQTEEGAQLDVQVPLGYRLLNAGLAYSAYALDSVWPSGLAVFYPYEPDSLLGPAAIGGSLFVVVATLVCLRSADARPQLLMGWLWFLGTLVPMIGLVQVGAQARADRYMYIPLIGLSLALAYSVPESMARSPQARRGLAVAAATVVAALGVVAYGQVRHWQGTETLFERAVAATGDNAFAHSALGRHHRGEGDLARAESHLEEALRLRPDSSVAPFDLGVLRVAQGRVAEGRTLLERARAAGQPASRVDTALGVAAERSGEPESAIAYYRSALDADPRAWVAANNLAWVLATEASVSDPAEAIRVAEQLASWNAHDPSVLDTLAASYAAAGRFEEALRVQTRAVEKADDPRLRADLESRQREYRARLGAGPPG
jgi:tetratricopeptide (TPR) repeat protein